MKPNNKQIQVIDYFKECLDTWKTSNDITNPSHETLIEESQYQFLENFKLNHLQKIDDITNDLFNLIKSLK